VTPTFSRIDPIRTSFRSTAACAAFRNVIVEDPRLVVR
jgi:hypothetical protein